MLSRTVWLLVLVAGAAGAQVPLGPDDAVRLALARPEVSARLSADIGSAEAALTAARTWLNPQLALEREAGDRAFGEPDETSLMLSQSFELGGRRALERRAAIAGLEAARAEVALERARLRAEVLQHYYDAVAAEQRHVALSAGAERLHRIHALAASRQAEGDLSGFEAMRIDQQRGRALLRRDAARAAADAARARLAARIGLDAGQLRLPAELDLLPATPAGDDPPHEGLELAVLAARRDHAAAELAAARRWRLPVSVGLGQKRFEGIGARDDALLVELSLPLPLFDRDQAARQRAEAAAQREEAAYSLSRQSLALRRDSASGQARQLVESARQMREHLLPQARELARIAEASFAEGELDLVGLIATLDDEIDAVEQTLELAGLARQALLELELFSSPAPNPAPSAPNGDPQ
jgi:outer membrane protein, heavy metal efflux system